MRTRLKTTLVALAFVGATLSFTTAAQRGAVAQASGGAGLKWLIQGPGAEALAKDPNAIKFFQGAAPYVRMPKNSSVQIPPGWNAIPFESFTSYRAIKDALDNNKLEPGVKAILYDSENWPMTPDDEKRDPDTAHQTAAQIVHSHNLIFIAAPAVDLARVLEPGTRGRAYEVYLRHNLAAIAARNADVVDIQAQGSQNNQSTYTDFVQRAAAQAKSANPNVIVIAGISTNPHGEATTSDRLLGAVQATRSMVQGYWLNMPQKSSYCPNCTQFRPDIAIDFLRKLGT